MKKRLMSSARLIKMQTDYNDLLDDAPLYVGSNSEAMYQEDLNDRMKKIKKEFKNRQVKS